MVANQGVRAVLEGEEYEEAMGDLPVGFAGFYELIGIVSHMVGEMGWGHGREVP